MAKLLQTLTRILFLLLAGAATTALSQSTSFFYDHRNSSSTTDLTFQGDAVVVQLVGGNHIRLTEAVNEAVGRVLYPNPIHFWKTGGQVDFETTLIFRITPSPDRSPADGIVFFIAPVGSTPPNGAAGGNFGVFESSGNGPAVFAVEFDTFVNEWDPDHRHIGIDIGSRFSIGTAPVPGDAILEKDVTATIRYDAAEKMISVAVSTETEKVGLTSYGYDLSGLLPEQVQVGLSASTGGEVAVHEIFSWNFTSTMVNTGAPNRSRKQLIRQFV